MIWTVCFSIFLMFIGCQGQLRLCEADGTCRHCADHRYSYYRCNSQEDCFIGETCDAGFCCPNIMPIFSLQRELPSSLSLVCSTNEQYTSCYSACQPSCQDPTTPACPAPVCTPGCHCLPGYIRRDTSPRSACVPRAMCQAYDVTMRCADERRAYQTCGSSCPISCESRNEPRCAEKCVLGCFCKIPYILENGNDPLHSRCILPSECLPVHESRPGPFNPFLARQPQLSPSVVGYPTAPPPVKPVESRPPTLLPSANNQCPDPLKNFLSCGTKCPASCDVPVTTMSLECSLSCVAGCFCRLPYVLLNSTDSSSPCILPQLCPRPTPKPKAPELCTDPRKEWTNCSGNRCARSCANPEGKCPEGVCMSGCVCRAPYVLQDSSDAGSRCVLPSECDEKCDANKQFQTCGSSCPMGCDNLHPKNCAPCQAGCFCKNGMVFKDSASWRSSECVPIDECPTTTTSTTTSTTTTATTTTMTSPVNEAQTEDLAMILKQHKDSLKVTSEDCPATTFDVGARSCSNEMDCPMEQRCCRPLIVSLGVNPQRCVCPDPNAVWSSCGSRCPEYCGQSSVPVCSNTCNAGCHCAPGFVRARNDLAARCVPREQCMKTSLSHDSPVESMRKATIKEIPISTNLADNVAAAVIVSRDAVVLGKFIFVQASGKELKVAGEIFGLPSGRHAVVIHQFGDASDGCSRIGAPFSRSRTPSLGDLNENGRFERLVDWSVNDVIGRAIAIYRFSTAEWESSVHEEKAIACGTIGMSKS